MPISHGRSPSRLLSAHLVITLIIFTSVLWSMGCTESPSPRLAGHAPVVQQLTDTLLSLAQRLQSAPASERSELVSSLLDVALRRKPLFRELLQTDPAAALRWALPSDVRDKLPLQVQTQIEQQATAEGLLDVLGVLYESNSTGQPVVYSLKQATSSISLSFAGLPPTATAGSRVRVSGVQLEDVMALDSDDHPVETLQAALSNTFGEQRAIGILVNFQNDPANKPYTIDQAKDLIFTKVSSFYLETSFKQTWLTGDVVGWYTVAMDSTVCDPYGLATLAKDAATAAGVDLSLYTRHVFIFPKNACSWAGLGSVGGNPSRAWINGALTQRVVAHELGHNFGLYHAKALDCGDTVLGTSCTSIEYGDTTDVMGATTGQFNGFHKERLGWLNQGVSPPIATVDKDGTYELAPYETPETTRPKALKILKSTDLSTGVQTYYYIEFRQPIGFDSFMSSYPGLTNGVAIHMASGNVGHLLDLTPENTTFSDAALGVGKSFIDSSAGITFTSVSSDSTAAKVKVAFGASTCIRAKPSLLVTPASASTSVPGSTLSYNLAVTNNDNAACGGSNFDLKAVAPTGWLAVLGSSTLAISPGATQSVGLKITSPATAAVGSYTVDLSAVNAAAPTLPGTATATYVLEPNPCVHTKPTVTLSPAQSAPVAPGATVTFTLSVLNNDSSASCAASTFNLSASVPAGWTAAASPSSLTVQPGAAATASLTVTSPASAIDGSTTITATATNSADQAASASASALYVVKTTSSCLHANPSVTLSPAQGGSVPAGTPVTYTVAVTNNDSGACTASSFALKATVPTGWSAAFASTQLTISPGSTISTALTITSSSSSAAGTYSISASATNTLSSGLTGSATAAYVVAPPPCVRAKPSLALSPAQSNPVKPGTAVSYSVALTNNDGSSCLASRFDLKAGVPTGWNGALGSAALTLAPGASASTTLTVTSPLAAADGSYTVGVTATHSADSSLSAAAFATYVILTKLEVSVATDKPSYALKDSVTITVKVTDQAKPVASAAVEVTITRADGTHISRSLSTSTGGIVQLKYRLKPKDVVGTYQVGAAASFGTLTGQGSASFTVGAGLASAETYRVIASRADEPSLTSGCTMGSGVLASDLLPGLAVIVWLGLLSARRRASRTARLSRDPD